MTQMAFPIAYPSARRAAVATATPTRWRLLGAEVATALAVTLGPATAQPAHRHVDRGVVVAATAPGIVAAAGTSPVAVQPSITSW